MEKKEMIRLETIVASTLFEVGVPANIKGYRYLKKAIMMTVENMEAADSISKEIYVPLANHFQTTARSVENAIRNAIEIAWDRGDFDTLQRYFGYTVSNVYGNPSNAEFIALIADKLQLQLRCEEIMDKKETNLELRTRAHLKGSGDLREAVVANALFEIGVPADIKGYRYLKKAIMMAMENMDVIDSISEEIYVPLANQFQTTSQHVQSTIRRAVEIAWDRGDIDVLRRYFSYTISSTRGKPTNSEFIALVAETLQLQLMSEKTIIKADQENKPCDAACLVSEALREVGIPDHLKGSQYLREAILLAIADESAIYDLKNKIYTPVAKLFGANIAWVKKAMAHAVLVSWDETGDLDTLMAYFGYTISNVKGYPTISEFIALFAERIRLGLSPINN